MSEMETCKKCGGDGKIDGYGHGLTATYFTCPDCFGTGKSDRVELTESEKYELNHTYGKEWSVVEGIVEKFISNRLAKQKASLVANVKKKILEKYMAIITLGFDCADKCCSELCPLMPRQEAIKKAIESVEV